MEQTDSSAEKKTCALTCVSFKGDISCKIHFLGLKCILLYIWSVYKYRQVEIILFYCLYLYIVFWSYFSTCSDFSVLYDVF